MEREKIHAQIDDDWGSHDIRITPEQAAGEPAALEELNERLRAEFVEGVGFVRKTAEINWEVRLLDEDGDECDDILTHGCVVIHPDEPEPVHPDGHQWVEISSRAHGGGVIVKEQCPWSGVVRMTDTWADDGHGGVMDADCISYGDHTQGEDWAPDSTDFALVEWREAIGDIAEEHRPELTVDRVQHASYERPRWTWTAEHEDSQASGSTPASAIRRLARLAKEQA